MSTGNVPSFIYSSPKLGQQCFLYKRIGFSKLFLSSDSSVEILKVKGGNQGTSACKILVQGPKWRVVQLKRTRVHITHDSYLYSTTRILSSGLSGCHILNGQQLTPFYWGVLLVLLCRQCIWHLPTWWIFNVTIRVYGTHSME